MAIWHAGNTISNIISGFLAAGILEHMDQVADLHAWQWFCKLSFCILVVYITDKAHPSPY